MRKRTGWFTGTQTPPQAVKRRRERRSAVYFVIKRSDSLLLANVERHDAVVAGHHAKPIVPLTLCRPSGDNEPIMADPEACAGDLPRHALLDVCVHAVTMAQSLEAIARFVASGRPHHVVTLDASMCVAARTDTDLRRIVLEADLVTPDSAGVLWAARRLGIHLSERVSGVDIVSELAAWAPTAAPSMYLLGAAPGVAEEAGARLQAAHAGCRIVGTHDGYFSPDEDDRVIAEIRRAKPDVLCVAMGIPKQEKWIACHREALEVPVMIGVGGTLDVLSGRARRAPAWMRRTNLEWLYRVMANPRKLRKVMALPVFVAMALKQRR